MNKQAIQTTYLQVKRLAAFLLLSLFMNSILAQEIRVTVHNRYNPMPPQAMLYANDPGRFFSITLQNRSDRPITLFLGIELEKEGLRTISLQTPVRFSPSKGITIQPGRVHQLLPAELKQLFRYINLNDVRLNGAIMTNFTTGKQPLLPEGHYTGRVVAYEVDHDAEHPLVLSDPRDGVTNFWVCYTAKAPQITVPAVSSSTPDLLLQGSYPTGTYVLDGVNVVNNNSAIAAIANRATTTNTSRTATAAIANRIATTNSSRTATAALSNRTATTTTNKVANAAQSGNATLLNTQNAALLNTQNYTLANTQNVANIVNSVQQASAAGYYSNDVVAAIENVVAIYEEPTLSLSAATLNTKNPVIQWMAPQRNCSGSPLRFTYTLEIVPLRSGRSPEEAIRYDGKILQRSGIATTQFVIPTSVINLMERQGGYYVARVTAVPPASSLSMSSNNYIQIENNGQSPLCVFKVEKKRTSGSYRPGTHGSYRPGTHTGHNQTKSTDDEEEEEEEEEEEVELPDFLISQPHLTTPMPSLGTQSRILNTGDSICMAWEKPTLVKGEDKARYDKLTFKYNVQLYKYKTGQPIDSMLLQKPIYSKELDGMKDTIRWEKMEKALERSEQLIALVTAKVTSDDKDVKADPSDKKNIAQLAYLKSAAETFGDCHPGYSETISDKTLGNFTRSDLKGKEVKVGEFTLIIDELEKTKIKEEECYKGTGYVRWKPYGKGFEISVEFDSLWINAAHEVYRGKVRSSRTPKALNKQIKEYIPYDMFDDLDMILGAGQSKEIADKYADKLADKLDNYYQKINNIADLFSMASATGWTSVELPARLPRTDKDNPVSIQLFNAEFSPNTAWINVFAQILIPECPQTQSQILAFTAPHICISPDQPLTDGIASLMGDFTFTDPKTNFGFTFRSPSQFNNPDDGTWISWSTNKQKQEMEMDSVQIQVEMSLNNLLKDDGKGGVVKGEIPVARLQTRFKDWGDWMALAEVEPFQHKELPGYTFNLTKGGMWYDHSSDANPKNFKLPKDKGYVDNALKDDKQWQGFWLSKAEVQLPFDADESKNNNQETKKRVSFSIDDVFIDKHGFTVDFNANDVGRIKESGWSISLDHAYARVVQNGFKYAGLKGIVGVPLFDKGDIPYEAKMSWQDEEFIMQFNMSPKEDMSVDAWRIKATIDKASRINVGWTSKKGFKIGALLSGSLTLDLKDKMGALLPGVIFKNMYIANYDMLQENPSLGGSESSENTESAHAGKSHGFYCSIGDWSTTGIDDYKDLFSSHEASGSDDSYLLAVNSHGPAPELTPRQTPAVQHMPSNVIAGEVGGFKISLDKVEFLHKSKFSKLGIYIKGSGSLFYDQVGASLGLKVWANMNWDTYKVSYDDTKFSDIACHGSLGGSACTIDGTLKELSEGGESGWDASLDFEIRELFKMVAAGKYSKVKDSQHGTYHSFCLSLGMKSETGIPLGVVSIDSIGGGFYYNCKLNRSAEYGTCAFALGVGLKTTGSSNLMKGSLDGLVIYDYAKKSLSKIRFDGKVHALCGTNSSKGLVNSNVMVEYNNDNVERAFRIQATVQGGVSESDLLAQCKNFVGNDSKFQKLCNNAQSASDMANNKLNEFGIGSGDSNKSTEQTKSRSSIESSGEIKASSGLKLSFDFAVVNKKADKKTKWHVYIGEPTRDKRCTLTLIDFQLGKKSDAIAAWCRIYANAYVCLGNELPNGGAMPDLPEKVQNYLYKTNKNVDANNGTSAQTQQRRKAEFNKITTASGNSPGGVMFGAEAGGEFGINAVLCYARADLVAGFDVAMLFARDMMCSNGKPAGKNGFYCNGQVYGYAGGQLGLMIKTRLWTGKFPIVDAGIGALLKGGFVNPTWVYGKLKAHCKLLGGLIKFKSTIEVKAGDICLPVAKNPLEDIRIFGGADPGSDSSSEGWEKDNEVSVFTRINFSTNMAIGADLRLLDENIAIKQAGVSGDAAEYAKNAERVFRFKLDETMPLYIHRMSGSSPSKSGQLVGNYHYQSIAGKNNTEFYMKIGPAVLEPEQGYRMVLTGHGYEIVNGVARNPLSLDAQKMQQGIREEWKDTYTFYFRTGPLSTDLKDYVQFSFPTNGTYYAPINEAREPKLVLKRDVGWFMNNPDYEYLVELQEYDSGQKDFVKTKMNTGYVHYEPDVVYHSDKPYYHIDVRGSNNHSYHYPYKEVTKGKRYRYVFYRYRKADMDNAINALKQVYKKTILSAPSGNYDAKGNSINSANMTAIYNNSNADGVKLSADGKSVVVTGADGKTYTMPLDTQYESISKVLEDYSKDFDKAVGSEDNRESRINELVKRRIKKEAYMDKIYSIEFTPSEYTLKEMINNKNMGLLAQQARLYTQFIDQEGRGTKKSPPQYNYYYGARPQAEYKSYSSKSEIYLNPYDFLNYMCNYVFLNGVTLKQGYFYPNNITSAQGLGLKFSNRDLRGGIVNGSDNTWHGTLFEKNLNVRNMMLGDNKYEIDIPHTPNGYFTGPLDVKRRVPVTITSWSYYKNGNTPMMDYTYYSVLLYDSWLAWRVDKIVREWADLYRQYYSSHSGEKEQRKWVQLMQGTISSGVSGSFYTETTNGNWNVSWKVIKSYKGVGDNGLKTSGSYSLSTLQFPAMQGLWNQFMKECNWKDGVKFGDNATIKLENLTTASGWTSRHNKYAWEVLNGWTVNTQGGDKPIYYTNYPEFDWKAYLRGITQFRYAVYKPNAYNTDTGEDALHDAYGLYPVVTVYSPFQASKGWTMPTLGAYDY